VTRGAPRAEEAAPELVHELLEGNERSSASSSQYLAALLVGSVLLAVELLAAPMVLAITVAASLVTWWLLDAPWAGRRRHARRRGISGRLLYLGTLMLVGLWLGVMFIFRASDPTLSSGFTTTLPFMIWGADYTLLQRLNGMESVVAPQAGMAIPGGQGFAPFSLFVHGTASTLAVSLMAYAVVTARRRLRRRLREKGILPPRESRRSQPFPPLR
jgi:hypothetical protein